MGNCKRRSMGVCFWLTERSVFEISWVIPSSRDVIVIHIGTLAAVESA